MKRFDFLILMMIAAVFTVIVSTAYFTKSDKPVSVTEILATSQPAQTMEVSAGSNFDAARPVFAFGNYAPSPVGFNSAFNSSATFGIDPAAMPDSRKILTERKSGRLKQSLFDTPLFKRKTTARIQNTAVADLRKNKSSPSR